jgi:hypothetical protein
MEGTTPDGPVFIRVHIHVFYINNNNKMSYSRRLDNVLKQIKTVEIN